jgi:lipopolysaccharide export system protein LptA
VKKICFFSALFLLFAAASFGQEDGVKITENSYLLEADDIYGIDNISYTAIGNVRLFFKNTKMFADKAVYTHATRSVIAEGNVVMLDEEQIFRADRVEYDLNSEVGIIDNATGVLRGEYYICAEKINRLDKDYYHLIGVQITTCSAPIPEWSFSFKEADAEIGGYLFGNHSTVNINNYPVLYSPKMIIPLITERQTGFLPPTFGYSNELGAFLGGTFFWAIDVDKDMTLKTMAFTERGALLQGEFRYNIYRNSRIYLAGESINDTLSNAKDNERWRYTSKSLVKLPLTFEFTADADMVSDYLYMRDFSFFSIYNDAIENEENVFNERYSLASNNKYFIAGVAYGDERKYSDTSTGYRLSSISSAPELYFRNRYRTLGSLLNFDVNIRYNQINNRILNHNILTDNLTDITARYERYYGELRLYRTFNLPIMRLTPGVTAYYTRWGGYDNARVQETTLSSAYIAKKDNDTERFIPKITVQAAINEIYKNYGDVRHGIQNTVTYTFIDDVDQRGLPNILANDRIEKANEIAWTLKSYYNPQGWKSNISVRQGFNLNTEGDKPMSPIEGKLYIAKDGRFSNSMEIGYDYYKDNVSISSFENTDQVVYFTDDLTLYFSNIYLGGRYVYDRRTLTDNQSEVSAYIAAKLSDFEIKGSLIWNTNEVFMQFNKLNSRAGRLEVSWVSQCYSIGMLYQTEKYIEINSRSRMRESTREHLIGISISLKGIGETKARVYSLRDERLE